MGLEKQLQACMRAKTYIYTYDLYMLHIVYLYTHLLNNL